MTSTRLTASVMSVMCLMPLVATLAVLYAVAHEAAAEAHDNEDSPPTRSRSGSEVTPDEPAMYGRRIEPMTAGAPPQGVDGRAIALFEGTDWSGWHDGGGNPSEWMPQGDGTVKVGTRDAVTRREFGDMQLHLEFLCPEVRGASGQDRANSGVYLQGRYEIQILDSYGLAPAADRCAAIYGAHAPECNASLPSGFWQTYDIIFRAPRLDENGAVKERARLTLLHNGVVVHNNVELAGPTPGAIGEGEVAAGPLMLQAHGHPVLFRNIWIRSR